jgi:hypothetical protein
MQTQLYLQHLNAKRDLNQSLLRMIITISSTQVI